jgi:enamine deaminase RidA (YjgF/YER057c/UK114 family)
MYRAPPAMTTEAMEMPASVADQARNCFTTIAASLAALDASLSDVVRARYYVTKPEHFDAWLRRCWRNIWAGSIRQRR